MASAQLDAAIAELPEADRHVFLAVLEVVETILAQLERIGDALAAFDLIDDIRERQITELRAIAAGDQAPQSIDANLPAAQQRYWDELSLARSSSSPDLLAARQVYWDELARLRAVREEANPGA